MTAAPLDRRPNEGRGGSIYDLGYRGYEGPRLGRRAAIWALLAHSVRTAYGFGRSARSKVMPIGILVMALAPSLLALGVLVLIQMLGAPGEAVEAISPIGYGTLFPIIAVLVFLFCAAQAPELFGRDQQSGILPLYFSRAVGRLDYALARFLGLFFSLLVLVLVPYLVLFVGRVLVAPSLVDGLAKELPDLPPSMAIGLIVAGLVGSLSAAISSFTPRRSYATVAIIAVFLIANVAASMIVFFDVGLLRQLVALASPPDVLDGVNAFLFDIRPENVVVRRAGVDGWLYLVSAVVWIGGSLAVLGYRYRRMAL
jgi:ABC-2 type transport system permease protein